MTFLTSSVSSQNSRERSNFLNAYDLEGAMRSKNEKEQNSSWNELKNKTQEAIQAFFHSCAASGKNKNPEQLMHRFLQKRVCEKIASENAEARQHYLSQGPGSTLFEDVLSICPGVSIAPWFAAPDGTLFSLVGNRRGLIPLIGTALCQGARPRMEDVVFIRTALLQWGVDEMELAQVLAVCDGHSDFTKTGGAAAAAFVEENFVPYLQREVAKYGGDDAGLFAAFKETFSKLSYDYIGAGGSTVCCAVIVGKKIMMCNLGDSRAILVFKDRTVQLTDDQKANNTRLIPGVTKRGGVIGLGSGGIDRVNGYLAMLRAMGDHCLKGTMGQDCIGHTPKITTFPLEAGAGEAILLIASDGLWDVATSEQVAEFIRTDWDLDPSLLAGQIVCKAVNASNAICEKSSDNVSVVVMRVIMIGTPFSDDLSADSEL